jgi:outer membrane protein TolC
LAAALLVSPSVLGPGASHARGQEPGVAERALSLDEAIAEALDGNTGLRIAASERAAAAAGARAASAFLWPGIELESGLTSGVDPVFAFGTKLRQSRFRESDFDPDALNDPQRLDDWGAAVDLRWQALSPGLWAARSAARYRSESARWSALRAREATVLGVRVRYWHAVQASAQRASAEATEDAARASLERFQRRQERGLLTEADRLQAEAELAAAMAGRIDAERQEREARQQLGIFLGWDPEVLPVPSDTLEEPTDFEPSTFDPRSRGDIRALAEELEARGADRRRATLAYAPSVDTFWRFVSHSSDPLESDATDWSAGVALRWTAFDGLRRPADLERAQIGERIARMHYEEALREAQTEADAAWRAVRSARRAYEAAHASRTAAQAAVELIRRRFEQGLTTPDEMLQAEARAAAARSRAVAALAAWHVARARAEFVAAQTDSMEAP